MDTSFNHVQQIEDLLEPMQQSSWLRALETRV